jgi:non-specific serine/threonine protein kinase/serine/threonine-protein kinase
MMAPGHDWDRITELLDRATQAPTAGEREALLAASGEDPGIIEQVRRLIAAWEADPDFLDPKPEVFETVGPWRIVREIGRGGAGQVFEAVHVDPTDGRRVAIKVIAAGRMNPAQTELFLQERAMLAKLEHPGIARLYDTGRTPAGAPYFAMEFVDGLPVDQWLGRNSVSSVRTRVQVFARVVQALMYAHSRLIVHGDLKPANVLITADGEPRLLDFGAGRSLTSSSDFVWPMLTPDYASPEQLRGEPVSPISDVYQAGLLLKRLVPECATDPELGAITARCLEEDPAKRYGSAAALLADLDAWLACRPVSVIPPNWTYRTRKFVRRNPTGALLAVSLAAGVTATGWQAWRAHQSSRESLHRFEETRRVTRAMLQDIDRLPVDARKPIVQSLAMLLDRTANPDEKDPVVLLELAYAWRTLGAIQGLPNSPNLGDPVNATKSYEKAIALAERARRFDDRTALERLVAYYAEIARVQDFLRQRDGRFAFTGKLEAATQALRRYGPSDSLAYALGEIAYFKGASGDRKAGIEAFRETIRAFEAAGLQNDRRLTSHLKRFGALLLAENQIDEGAAQYRRALAIERAVGREPFETSFTLSDLALASFRLNRHAEALAYCNEMLAIREQAFARDPSDVRVKNALANGLGRLSRIQRASGSVDQAIATTNRQIHLFSELVSASSSSTFRISLGDAKVELASLLNLQDPKRHAGEIRSLVAAIQGILKDHPNPSLAEDLKQLQGELARAAH